MKCQVPQISWHSRDPVLSIDFQPNQTDILRLASCGSDSHVLIWYVTYQENKSIKIECASDLNRHNKAVNVVRFSPNGVLLASGDDEGAIFIWQLKEREQMIEPPNDDEIINKEDWYPVKLLRGHLDDVLDICWSKDGNFLVSTSMDNTVILWDMQKYVKTHIFSDFKGFPQGVTWDPCSQFIASIGSDRLLRIHNISSKKTLFKISKAPWTNSTEKGTFKAKLFYDDTLQSYCRRLTFTPDGELLIVPSGISEKGEKINNTCYIFSRHALNKPVVSLPTGDKYTLAVRCNPLLYKLRKEQDASDEEKSKISKPIINLPYRMIFAVAACESVLFYDTEQLLPFAYVSNIHYTHLTDLSWTSDGLTLVASSTDGYCSFILFTREELGEIYIPSANTPDVKKETDQNVEVGKNEKVEANQSTDQITAPDSEGKGISAPSTPKSTKPVSAKTPKSNSITSDENVTPSSKSVKITTADNKKNAKKSPKMCSIKKFFISPKTVPSTSVCEKDDKSPKHASVNEETKPASGIEVVELSDSPMKVKEKGSANDTVSKDNSKGGNTEAKSHETEQEEAMDVDDNQVESICTDKLQTAPLGNSAEPEKKSKCKVRLNFGVKEELMAAIDDNASDSNPLTSDSTKDSVESKVVKESENDWKLELSQDDEIVPMETTAVAPESKLEVPKAFDLNTVASNNKPTVSVPIINEQKMPKEGKTPKRRVAFVTLSTKPTFKK